MSHKKRKISDLTVEDTSRLFLALAAFQENLDETDEDLPPELIPALSKLATKLKTVPHLSFSRVDEGTLNHLGITLRPMVLRGEKLAEIEALGCADTEGNWMSIGATKELLRLIRSHVSRVNEAGSRMLINIFLLRLASVMSNKESEVNILPEFPISKTMFENHSFAGVVDFLVVQAHSKYNDLLLETPIAALGSQTGVAHHANIFEAKRDNVKAALSQAVVAAASYCKEHKLTIMRGCTTNGEQWAFFVYASDRGESGEVSVAREITLGADLERLSLLLGLLRDWVENARDYEQKFFTIM